MLLPVISTGDVFSEWVKNVHALYSAKRKTNVSELK